MISRRIRTFITGISYSSVFLLVSIFFFCASQSLALAAPATLASKLIEGAKKEGKLMLYSSVTARDTGATGERFKEKYPFIKVEYLRLSSERLLNKILQETSAGTFIPDIYLTGVAEVYIFTKKGLIAKYLSPERASYREYFKDPEGYATAFFHTTKVIAYNIRLVSPDKVPKSYENLLHPQWKGKLGMPTGGGGVRWFLAMMKVMGDESGKNFMDKLAAQNVVLGPDITAVTALLAAGEYPVVVFTNAHQVEQLKRQGAPIEWVPTNPVLTTQTVVAISGRAPNPSSARLYVDFILSKEGQELIRGLNRLPARSDVDADPPRLTKGLNLSPYKGEWGDEYGRYAEMFHRLFH